MLPFLSLFWSGFFLDFFYFHDLDLITLHSPVMAVLEISAATDLDGDLKTAVFVDDINAYSFVYPVELPRKKFVFKWWETEVIISFCSVFFMSACHLQGYLVDWETKNLHVNYVMLVI